MTWDDDILTELFRLVKEQEFGHISPSRKRRNRARLEAALSVEEVREPVQIVWRPQTVTTYPVASNSFWNILFGCNHDKTTFPQTRRFENGSGIPRVRTYIACLDCGREFDYDWQSMQVGKPISKVRLAAEVQREYRPEYR